MASNSKKRLLLVLTVTGFNDPKRAFRDPKGFADSHLRTTAIDFFYLFIGVLNC